MSQSPQRRDDFLEKGMTKSTEILNDKENDEAPNTDNVGRMSAKSFYGRSESRLPLRSYSKNSNSLSQEEAVKNHEKRLKK